MAFRHDIMQPCPSDHKTGPQITALQ